MQNDMVVLLLQVVILVGGYFVGKYIPQDKVEKSKKELELITNYADSFVRLAREFMKDEPGAIKMSAVVSKLSDVCIRNNIDMSETDLKAITQNAYDMMKSLEK